MNSDPKRILALDGGGVRGVFAIEVLHRIETVLRQQLGRPKLVLADHFHLLAGTSAGAIIATLLCWGESMDNVRALYHAQCERIFPRAAPWRIWRFPRLLRHLARSIYSSEEITAFLKNYFRDPETGHDALLGSNRLRTLLLICTRNASTGSAWPVTNNPAAQFNRPGYAKSNLNLPLWQLVRASTAAPIYFPPEKIAIGEGSYTFIDGGMTPYNNPALIAYLMATQPCYHVNWPSSVDRLRLVSVGNGRVRSVLKNLSLTSSNMGASLVSIPSDLMDGISQQQDHLCRVLGACIHGERIDREVGDLVEPDPAAPGDRKFTYVRYDSIFAPEEVAAIVAECGSLTLSNLRALPHLVRLGQAYAQEHVKPEHVL